MISLKERVKERGMLFFWGHTNEGHEINQTCLSQWWPCQFTDDKETYCCAEQYMMYQKAILFKDFEYAEKILKSSNPKKIKEYGRMVRNFDNKIWDKEKEKIVTKGNYLKFSQNPDLKEFLLSTNDSILVEASPYDTVWGIGLRATSEDAKDIEKWKGKNLLGFILMDVRNLLRYPEKENDDIVKGFYDIAVRLHNDGALTDKDIQVAKKLVDEFKDNERIILLISSLDLFYETYIRNYKYYKDEQQKKFYEIFDMFCELLPEGTFASEETFVD